MLMKYITFQNDKNVHLQSPFGAGQALCGKSAMKWHNSKREPTCKYCLLEQKRRPYKTETPEIEFPEWFTPYKR